MLVISATQAEGHARCRRYWWFNSRAKLPRVQKGYFTFGTCIHSVAERYLRADLNGYLDGEPLELYPEGWDRDEDGNSLTLAESALVKTLVRRAIEEGILERRPGGVVEGAFELPVIDGVKAVGYKDYVAKARVEDHKSSKSRRYLLSSKKLAENLQLRLYAYDYLWKSRQRGERDPDSLELVHNQFVKGRDGVEEPGVYRALAMITPKDLDEFFQGEIVPQARQMLDDWEVTDPWTFPDPPAGACAAYGGCPFQSICGQQETIAGYIKRVDNYNKNRKTQILTDEPQGAPKMSLQDFLAKKANKVPPAATTATGNSPTPAPEPAAQEPVRKQSAPAPWHRQNCPACSNNSTPGISTTGAPCRICVSLTKISPTDYESITRDDGAVVWIKKGSQQPVAVAQVAPAQPAVVEKRIEPAALPVLELTAEEIASRLSEATMEQLRFLKEQIDLVEKEDQSSASFLRKMLATRLRQLSPEAPSQSPPPGQRKPGRPKKVAAPAQMEVIETPPAPVEPKVVEPEVVEPEEADEPAEEPSKDDKIEGLVLLIGCSPLRYPDPVTVAEELLSGLPDYWKMEAFPRRGDFRNMVQESTEFRDRLKGKTVVASVRDPDVDNLMSSLLPFAQIVIRGVL